MQTAIKTNATVQAGHQIIISDPTLPEGEMVEVIVVLPERPAQKQDILSFIDSLPPGPRSAAYWEERERELQEQRDSWDRPT